MVSVIVPAYNAAQTLRGCVDALLAQDFSAAPYEILVVDNASTDETWSIIESYGAAVRGLKETKIQSSYAARNAGVIASRGRILAFTDADCVPDHCWLSQLVDGFKNSVVGCVAGDILALNPITSAEKFAEQARLVSHRREATPGQRPYAVTANVAYRREVFDQIGLFVESLESGGDVDFSWRMQEQTTWTLHFDNSVIVRHRHRDNWLELWKQCERYGSATAALHLLHPYYKPPLFRSILHFGRLFVDLVRCSFKFGIHQLVPRITSGVSREVLQFAFYYVIRQSAFILGMLRGKKGKWSRREKIKRRVEESAL